MLYTTKIGLPTIETGDKTTEIETQNKNRDKQNGCSHKDRNRDTVTEIGTNTIDVVTKTEIKTPFQKKGQTQQMQSQKQKQRHRRRKRDKQNINRDKHNKIGTNTT